MTPSDETVANLLSSIKPFWNMLSTIKLKLKAEEQISMPPIKIVPMNNSNYSGWAFVGIADEEDD